MNVQEKFHRDLDKCPTELEAKCMKLIYDHPNATNCLLDVSRALVDLSKKHPQITKIVDFIGERVAKVIGSLRKEEVETAPPIRRPQRVDSPTPNDTFLKNIETGETSPYKEAVHYVIGASNFTERGWVRRFKAQYSVGERGTTMVLESLTPDTIDGCEMKVRPVDDQFGEFPYEEILEQARQEEKKVIVSMAGVQTSQYPRAVYIAAKIRAQAIKEGLDNKIDILFGGFHVRGDEKYQDEVVSCGFTAFDGEAEEGRLGETLKDSVHNRIKSKYQWKDEKGKNILVELKGNPLPAPSLEQIDPSRAIIFQTGRGCPYGCSFCGVQAIDGNKMRYRTVEEVTAMAEHLAEQGLTKIFLADDNFYRHPKKNEILDMLIEMKKKGHPFTIMMQSDIRVVKKGKIDTEFMDKCKEAGVHNVFVGTESFDYDVLEAMGKIHNIKGGRQQFIEDMKLQREAWNERGIGVGFTCIIGSENDRPGVGKRSAEIALEVGANAVIPFILGVIPGSKDYKQFQEDPSIVEIDPDLNKHNSSRATLRWKDPTSLTPEQIEKERDELTRTFYDTSNMEKVYHSIMTTRHFYWYMWQTRMGNAPMDGGMWPVIYSEKRDDTQHEENLRLCGNTSKAV